MKMGNPQRSSLQAVVQEMLVYFGKECFSERFMRWEKVKTICSLDKAQIFMNDFAARNR